MRLKRMVLIAFSLVFSVVAEVHALDTPSSEVVEYQEGMAARFTEQEVLARWKIYGKFAIQHRDRPLFVWPFSDSVKHVVKEFEGLTITYTFTKEKKQSWDAVNDGLCGIVYDDRDLRIYETHIYKGPLKLGGVTVWDGPAKIVWTVLRRVKK